MTHNQPNFCIIIPARFESSRLPGKPLLDLEGKSMIERVWQRCCDTRAAQVVVATDDARIHRAALNFGAQAVMTSTKHQSGTDRLAEVVRTLELAADKIVVNVQGDEPLIPVDNISQVARLLQKDPQASMSTLCVGISAAAEINDPNIVKVVFSDNGNALYFSRSAIPFKRDADEHLTASSQAIYHRHIGIYAYRAGFLEQFARWPVSSLEQVEKLEQLRALEHGHRIAIAAAAVAPPPGIDTLEDAQRVRKLLRSSSSAGLHE